MIGMVKGTMREMKTVAGLPSAIASFRSNASGVNLSSLKVLVEAVQSGSGTPSPDNVRPITGWSGAVVSRTGKNLLTMDYLESGSISGSGAFINSPLRLRTSGSIYTMLPIKPSQVYTYSLQGAEGVTNLVFMEANEYSKDRVWLRNRTLNRATGQYTPSADCYYVIFLIRKSDNSTIDVSDVEYLQLEVGSSTATAYEPYNGNTYTIAFGDTYYGCELDVTNGVLTAVKKGRYVDSELSISYDSTNQRFFVTLPDMANNTSARNKVILCSTYENKVNVPYEASWDSVIYNAGGDRPKDIAIHDRRYTTVSDFVTYTSQNCFIVYPLATPIEIQLTPQQIAQLAENNVFADTGEVSECKYQNRIVTKLFSKG